VQLCASNRIAIAAIRNPQATAGFFSSWFFNQSPFPAKAGIEKRAGVKDEATFSKTALWTAALPTI
jgi:hypothetical protein